MYKDTLEISINPSYNADEFIDDLKAELEGEIDALPEIDPVKAPERIAIVKEIMKRLNLK